MTPTSRMSTVAMVTTLSPAAGRNTPATTAKTTSGGGNNGSKTNHNPDSTAISVAASAASLILVLVAIVVWYFLVRRQLLSKARNHQRLGSHKSHRSNPGSRQGSFRDSHSRHGSVLSHKDKNDHHGSHHGNRQSPKSSHRSSGSPRSHRHSGCPDSKEVCTCRKSYDSPVAQRHSPHSPKSNRNSINECTGNSPFCPHSKRFQHPNHRSGRDSVYSDLSDQACTPVEAVCTCEESRKPTRVITGADFTVVELEAHNRHENAKANLRNGQIPFALRDIPSTSTQQPSPIPQCTCDRPANQELDSPVLSGHPRVTHVQSDPGVIGHRGNAEMV